MNEIILVGAGGHCQCCIDIIESYKNFKIVGLIDSNITKKIYNYRVIGNDNSLLKLFDSYKYAFVSIGEYRNPHLREKIFNNLKKLNYKIPVFKSSNSYISKKSTINDGTLIMHNTVISTGVSIGYNCIINSGTVIEHNSVIQDNCNLSPGVIINGDVKIGKNTFIGSGSIIKEGITIGENCFIRMGTILKENLKENSKI